MRRAIWIERGISVSVEEYLLERGAALADVRAQKVVDNFACKFCSQSVSIRADAAGANRIAHFAHAAKSGYCHAKEAAAGLYRGLVPRQPDPAAGKILRARFRKYWRHHYARLVEIIDRQFFYREFLVLLDRATKNRVWEYRGLREDQIPYTLCCLADFNHVTGLQKPPRERWKRFWFSQKTSHLEDLWIRGCPEVTLMAGKYEIPKDGSSPGKADIDDLHSIEIDGTFLHKTELGELHPGVVKGVENWFAKHPHMFPKAS